MLTRISRLCAAAFLLVALLPAVALADTEPGPTPSDSTVVGVAFSFDDREIHWSGFALVEEERLAGQRFVSFYFNARGDSETCDAGTPLDPSDDYVGTQGIEFYSTSSSIKHLSVDEGLSSAAIDIALTGREVTTDACGGGIIRSRADRHRFKADLVAVGPVDTSTDSVIVSNGDGTFSLVTQTAYFVQATGTAVIDGQAATVVDANIQRSVVTVEPV